MTRPPYDPTKPLDGLTRRSLLAASVGTAGALLAGCSGVSLDRVLSRGSPTPTAAGGAPLPSTGERILVIVTLYGGNDGLGMVVPFADSAYQSARPGLAYSAEDVLPLDDSVGLNRSLPGLARAWQDRALAIVRGVGYPKPDRSHFRSMDIWQTASPEAPIRTGWIGRWLDITPGEPLLALGLGETLPPLLVGARSTAAALTIPRQSGPELTQATATITAYGSGEDSGPPGLQAARQAYSVLAEARSALDPVTQPAAAEAAPGDGGPATATGTGGSARSIGGQLGLVARCIRANVPTRVYSVSQSGYDSHIQEHSMQEYQLGDLDRALTDFRTAIADHPRAADVVVLIHSEFGRRLAGNASAGTDHGTASDVLLLGAAVSPGFHGEPPSLTALDDGDLRYTTDFRSVFAELSEKVLGVEAGRVIPQPKPALGVLT